MHRWNQPMNKTTQPKQIQNNIFKALHNLLAAELLICGTVCPLKLRTFLVKTSLTDQFAMFSCEVLSSRFYVILIALWYWVWIYVLCFLCFYVIFMFFNVFYVIVCIVILFLRLLVSTTCYIILLQHVRGLSAICCFNKWRRWILYCYLTRKKTKKKRKSSCNTKVSRKFYTRCAIKRH